MRSFYFIHITLKKAFFKGQMKNKMKHLFMKHAIAVCIVQFLIQAYIHVLIQFKLELYTL